LYLKYFNLVFEVYLFNNNNNDFKYALFFSFDVLIFFIFLFNLNILNTIFFFDNSILFFLRILFHGIRAVFSIDVVSFLLLILFISILSNNLTE
jgi:hypothetical protein